MQGLTNMTERNHCSPPGSFRISSILLISIIFLAPSAWVVAAPQEKEAPKKAQKAPPVKKAVQAIVKPAKPVQIKTADGKKIPLVDAIKKAVSGGAEKTAKGEKAPAETGKVRKNSPSPPMFHMRDGTRLAGIPEGEGVKVKTAYGTLTVPMRELVRIRFCSSVDSNLSEKIAGLIQQLGHEEFDLREEATEKLTAIGLPALKALEKAQQSEDEEIKARAEKLVAQLEGNVEEPDEDELHLIPLEGEEDEVETAEFTIKGRIEEQSFMVKTRYGSLGFKRADILSIVFQEPLVTRLSFDVPGATLAEKNSWFDSQADLAEGEEFRLKASGILTLATHNGTKCGPDGTRSIKRIPPPAFKEFPTGSLVGKIGKTGKPFLVGTDYDGVVEKKGRLFLGISLQSGVVQGKLKVVLEKRTR